MTLAILGAGSWGLTLAWLYAHAGRPVVLWDRSSERLARLQPGVTLEKPVRMTVPPQLKVEPDLQKAVSDADVIILVVTAQGTRQTVETLRPWLKPNAVMVNASKGIEHPSLLRLNQVLQEVLPGQPTAALSGPTLAQEILDGRPAAFVVASTNPQVCDQLLPALSVNQCFRAYSNHDVIGVELGGALKNIFAIASGYMATRQLGDNARSAIITRGLHEMARLSMALGAEESTLYGLSGLGDLLATCSSPLSRNYQVGVGLAQGLPLSDILSAIGSVAEGVETTRAVRLLADQLQLDVPIAQLIGEALDGHLSHDDFVRRLMSRRLKSELNE